MWFEAYAPKTPMTKIEARIWAKMNITLNDRALFAILGDLYATGYVFGKDVAGSAYAHAVANKAITEEEINQLLAIDWSKWEAGNHPAEALARPKGALKKLLDKRGLDLEGLNNTTLDRIGTQLANALKKGSTIEMLADLISNVVSDPERALTIANTSMASAMSVATLETYKEFGLEKMRWLALEPCQICQGNASAGPVTPGQAFPSGNTEPPAHPNCRCALAPVIDLNPAIPEITLATDPDLTKFDPNQPRDDRGRFSSNGGSAGIADTSATTTPNTDYRMRHQAPTRANDFGSPAYDIEEMMPDFYEHPEWYRSGDSQWDKESVAVIQRIKGNPDAPVTLYRAVPKDVTEINQGDWVTLSPAYARDHNSQNLDGKGHVISIEARARDLWFDGNSINEFGYDPDPEAPIEKFNSSQPRDTKGRWTSSGIAGWEKAQPDPQERGDLISKAQTRWQTTCAERGLQATPEEMERISQDVGAKYDRQFEKYDAYRQGNLYLEVDRSLPEGTAEEYAKNIADLKEKFPLNTDRRVAVVVTSDQLEYKSTVNGYTASDAEGTVIALSVTNMKQNLRMDLRTNPMPARNGQYYEEFTLAHEWGHAYDIVSKNAWGNIALSSFINNNNLGEFVSDYGNTSTLEQYAEVFAQSYIESKYPDAPKSPITPRVQGQF
jgi:hypothetical protein